MHTAGSAWRSVARVCSVNVLFAAGLFAHGFLYNFYLDALGLRASVLGNAAAALTLGGLLALLPAGWLTDRFGARRVYLFAALLLAAGLGAGAIVSTPLPIYTAAVIAGAGTAMWRVAMGPLLIQASPPAHRARTFSWNVGLLVGSGALWTALAGAAPGLIAAQTGWSNLNATRAALLLGAFGSVIGAALLAGSLAPAENAVPPVSSPPNLRSKLGVPPRFMIMAVVIAIWMTAGALVIPFFNLFFYREHALSVERVGALFAASQLIGAAVLFGNGELSARFGAVRVLLGWSILFGPLLWLLGGTEAIGLAMLLFVLQSVVPPATNALIDQLLMERAPEERRGAVSSWRNAATETSGFAGASAGGRILERGSYDLLLGVAGAVALVGAALLAQGLRLLTRGRTASAQADAASEQAVESFLVSGSDRTT